MKCNESNEMKQTKPGMIQARTHSNRPWRDMSSETPGGAVHVCRLLPEHGVAEGAASGTFCCHEYMLILIPGFLVRIRGAAALCFCIAGRSTAFTCQASCQHTLLLNS